MTQLICDVCGIEYMPRRATGTNRYCSNDCGRKASALGIARPRTPAVATGTTKTCTRCGEALDLSAFPIRKDRGTYRSHCRPCHNAAAKTDHSKQLQTEWRYQTKYGMTAAEVDELFARQGKCCAICAKPLTKRTRHVDHDHATGAVRGILCLGCNSGLGMFRDRIDVLHAAASYLDR